MPTKHNLVSIARVAISWTAFMSLVGVALTLVTARVSAPVDLPPFRIVVFACIAFVLHIAYDYWEKSHRVSVFVTVVVLSAVTGTLLGGLLWSRAFGDSRNTVLLANVLNSPPVSSSGNQFESSGTPGVSEAHPTARLGIVSAAGQADLSLTEDAAPDRSTLGTPFRSRLMVTNRGPVSARHVQLSDRRSTSARVVAAMPSQGTCASHDDLVTCAFGDVVPGGQVAVEIMYQPRQPGTFRRTASVTSTEKDPNGVNNSTVITTVVMPMAQ